MFGSWVGKCGSSRIGRLCLGRKGGWCSRAAERGNWPPVGCLAGLAKGDPGGHCRVPCPACFHSAGRGHNCLPAGLGHALLQFDHCAQSKSPARWRSLR